MALWIKQNNRPKSYIYFCSDCGGQVYMIGDCRYPYCPYCKSEMDKQQYRIITKGVLIGKWEEKWQT